MKRLMIYFVYDKDGIVDDYIPYFLKSFKPFCEEICVVVNGLLTNDSKKVLEENCNTLLVRENVGFDSGAYKHAIEYYGYEKIREYDELILANFTMFGPIFSPQEMFEKMNSSDCDFWGITKHPDAEYTLAGIKVEEHIQSYFIDFKKKLINSADFKEYWQTLKVATSYEEAIAFHELRTTAFYEGRGYKSNCYIDRDKYHEKLKNKPYIYYLYQQIEEDKMPFIKRKAFAIKKNCFMWKLEKDANEILDFVKKNTNYNLKLILKNLKRTEFCDITFKGIFFRLINLIICKFFIFWKKEHYKNKLASIRSIYKFLKEMRCQDV